MKVTLVCKKTVAKIVTQKNLHNINIYYFYLNMIHFVIIFLKQIFSFVFKLDKDSIILIMESTKTIV